jgi:hypothetical protein
MPKKLLATFIISALVLSMQVVEIVNADFLGPINDLGINASTVEIISPQNVSFNRNAVLLNFTVVSQHDVFDVGYSLDNKAILRITSLIKISEESAVMELPPYILVTSLGTLILSDLSDGTHTVTVYQGRQWTGFGARYDILGFASVSFSIDTKAPNITIVKNQSSYNTSQAVPIEFMTNEPPSWMGYSLNNQANVTITGNTTVTGLTVGSHSLRVFANDSAGNMGMSNSNNFNITAPVEETLNFSLNQASLTAIVIVIVIVAVTSVSLFFFKRRKGKP